jgi:hypothetical protein
MKTKTEKVKRTYFSESEVSGLVFYLFDCSTEVLSEAWKKAQRKYPGYVGSKKCQAAFSKVVKELQKI